MGFEGVDAGGHDVRVAVLLFGLLDFCVEGVYHYHNCKTLK